jgi:hypothetical protein
VTAAWPKPATLVPSLAVVRPLPGPRPPSLDKGQQLRISDGRRGRAFDPLKAAERLARNDRSKAALAERILAASSSPTVTTVGGLLLWQMAGRLTDCRGVRAARDACGAWLARPNSCHVRLCPDCERSRSGKLAHRLGDIAAGMEDPRFGTLAISNVGDGELGAAIDVILDAFASLRRRAIFAGGTCRAEHYPKPVKGERLSPIATGVSCAHPPHRKRPACQCARCSGCQRCWHEPVRGGVSALETTRNRGARTWHPHMHLLFDGPWIDFRELRDAWTAATCDAWRRFEARGGKTTRGTGLRRPDGPRPRISLPRCRHVDWSRCAREEIGQDGRPHRVEECTCAEAEAAAGCRCLLCARANGCRGPWTVWLEAPRDRSPEGLAKMAREVTKYVTKGFLDKEGRILGDVAGDELAELLLSIRGRRLVSGWGSLARSGDTLEAEAEREDEPGAVFTWPDPRAGFPKICPACRMPAEWDEPINVPRRFCRQDEEGRLWWRPPPAPRPPGDPGAIS